MRYVIALAVAVAAAAASLVAASPVSAQVPLISREEAISATDGVSPKTVTVDCPPGTKVYNASGRINGGVGAVVLDDVTPSDDLTSVKVTAYETDPDNSWSLIAYAMCGSGVLNLQRIPLSSATDSVSPKSVNPTCPGTTRLYGLGAEITGGVGNVVMDDLIPNVGLTGVTATAYETGAYAGNWRIAGYAICGNPVTTMVRVSMSEPMGAPNAVTPKSATTPVCPAGTEIHGAGAEITGGLGNVSLDEVIPNLDVIATGYAIGAFAGNWRITAYGICAS